MHGATVVVCCCCCWGGGTLYTIHCTLYTVHFTLYIVHCTLYTTVQVKSAESKNMNNEVVMEDLDKSVREAVG